MRIKGLGVFVIFLQSPAGIITVLSVIYCLFMFDHFSSKYVKAITERTNMLVKLIDYDLGSQDASEVTSQYHETLLYKGSIYTFHDGEYVGKECHDGYEKVFKNHMIFVKKENGKNTVTVTNTKTNEVKVYEDVSEEDINSPEKFIPPEDNKDDEDDE